MEDIAPDLLEKIQRRFSERISINPKIRALYKRITDGAATYVDAEEYAYQVGSALSQAFTDLITPDSLPDGRLYYNIAQRLVRPMLVEDHQVISDAAALVQKSLNQKTGIGIKPQTIPVDEDRVAGIVDKVSNAQKFEDVSWVLDAPVKNFSMNVVDETLRANVNFQGRSGLRPKIVRKAHGKRCPWCRSWEGEYDYPDVPHEVYQRHANCRCTVDYDPGEGKVQDVHTKRWHNPGESDIIEVRKQYNMDNLGVFRPNTYRNNIASYVSVNRDAVVKAAKSGNRHAGVWHDAQHKTIKQLKRSIASRNSQVERHADKIKHPEDYVLDWNEIDPRKRAGLLNKWKKDMYRNAEQAEIELAVFEEMYGNE